MFTSDSNAPLSANTHQFLKFHQFLLKHKFIQKPVNLTSVFFFFLILRKRDIRFDIFSVYSHAILLSEN